MTQGKLLEFLEDIDLLEHFQLPTKWKNTLQVLPQETVLSEAEFHTLLDTYLPKLRSQQRTRIMEAAAHFFGLWKQQPISKVGNIPSLGTIFYEKSAVNSLFL
ncbi:hypothetical protein [Trichormus azollae]|uniref:hypothetical protein n=1 Tax=Trichormus azollae TaxID=1164 RepID=UPI00325CF971